MRSLQSSFIVLAVLLGASLASHAGTVQQAPDVTTWQAGVDGVEIEWAPNGEFARIYSAFYQPVSIPDRRGISKAQLIAEEKAKAAVVRFMDQQVSSKRTVEQIDKDLENATVTRASGAAEQSSKVNQRVMMETLTEVTTSYASGKLRGVIVLEKGYDERKGEAWVKVGISRKTMAVAAALKDATQAAGADGSRAGQAAPVAAQPSEVRRSAQKDW